MASLILVSVAVIMGSVTVFLVVVTLIMAVIILAAILVEVGIHRVVVVVVLFLDIAPSNGNNHTVKYCWDLHGRPFTHQVTLSIDAMVTISAKGYQCLVSLQTGSSIATLS